MKKIFTATTIIGSLLLTPIAAHAQTTTAPATTMAAETMPKMDLKGTKLAPSANATSTIDPAGAGKWKIHVEAHGLAKPTTLKAKATRKVYLVWVMADAHMKQMAVLTMKPGTKAGDYIADGTVALPQVVGLSVTADLKAGQMMPTNPMVTVLETPMGM